MNGVFSPTKDKKIQPNTKANDPIIVNSLIWPYFSTNQPHPTLPNAMVTL